LIFNNKWKYLNHQTVHFDSSSASEAENPEVSEEVPEEERSNTAKVNTLLQSAEEAIISAADKFASLLGTPSYKKVCFLKFPDNHHQKQDRFPHCLYLRESNLPHPHLHKPYHWSFPTPYRHRHHLHLVVLPPHQRDRSRNHQQYEYIVHQHQQLHHHPEITHHHHHLYP
jgi:hypothetical protein